MLSKVWLMLKLPNSWPVKLFCVAARSFCKVVFFKERLTILRQMKRQRSKPKPFFVWFSQNQFRFAAKTFVFGLHLLLGSDFHNTGRNHPVLRQNLFFCFCLLLGTDSINTGRNQHRFAVKNFSFGLHLLLDTDS